MAESSADSATQKPGLVTDIGVPLRIPQYLQCSVVLHDWELATCNRIDAPQRCHPMGGSIKRSPPTTIVAESRSTACIEEFLTDSLSM